MDGRKVDREVAAHFGRNLFRRRRWAGYSQEEVARQTGLHRTAIGMLEAGSRLPRLDTVMKIAGALGVKPEVLLAGIEWLPPGLSPEGSFVLHPERGRS